MLTIRPWTQTKAFLASLLALLPVLGVPLEAEGAKCPNLHMVLDRSGSMTAQLAGRTRWAVAVDAVKAVAERYDGKLPLGLSFFPGGGCDSVTPVPPAYKTKMAITMAVNGTNPTGSTPSGSAMRNTAAIKELRDPDRKHYVILITDGGPGCGGEPDTVTGTVNEITKARMQNPPIFTFVVGFGGGLSASEQNALSQMAAAGGKPAMTAEKYYKADTPEDLNKALEEILSVVKDEFGGGVCDDSCYSTPCKNPGDLCIRGECAPNPCATITCPKDQYCYTDGTTQGTCVRACTKACPKGTLCKQGSCISDPCGYVCPPGLVCNTASKRCESDPLCENIPIDNQCKGTSRCQFGKCVDDPCRFITCPKDTACVNWDGSCVSRILPTTPDMAGSEDTDFDGNKRGCAAVPGSAATAPLASLLSMLGVLVLLPRLSRRRRKP